MELREIHLPLVNFFETSFGRTCERRIILLTVHADEGIGYGECTAAEGPFYSHETTETAWHILSDFVIPSVLETGLERARETASVLAPIRGHNMAKAALETALWDLEARRASAPLSEYLGGVRHEIPCGVSIGIQDTIDDLLTLVRREVSAGYRRIKIKIKPGWEIEPLRAIRAEFPKVALMADANSAFRLSDLPLLRALDEFGLMMIEQPLSWDDMVDHALLQKELNTPLCLDESIHSVDDARKAIEMGSCRIINVKLGRVGGYTEALKINGYCFRNKIPIWCGGMLESGVGRAHNIALSTLAGFILPGDVSASKRYYVEDTVSPPVTVTADGTIRVPQSPGLGYELDWERIQRATVRTKIFTSTNTRKQGCRIES